VKAFDAQTGLQLATFTADTTLTSQQPLLTDDSLLVSSSAYTYIFDLSTGQLRQKLNHGGQLTLAQGRLYVAATNGNLYTYDLQPPAPLSSAPDLAAASDSGTSSTDNLTKINTPTFTGTAAAGSHVLLLGDGQIIGSGTADAGGNWSVTSSALTEGAHQVSAVITGAGADHASAPLAVTIDATAPVATGVFVSSSSWSPAFLSYLATSGKGSATLGYRLPAGAQQLSALPWTNVDRISIQFSENVDLGTALATLAGANTGAYNLANLAFDPATHTATWTIDRPLASEILQLTLSGSPKDNASNPLDGEWTDGVSTASGNGTPGGDFAFQMRVLAGDSNGDGVDNFADFVILSNNYGKTVPPITTLANPASLVLVDETRYAPTPKKSETLEISSDLPTSSI
jgi:hypothetical protein